MSDKPVKGVTKEGWKLLRETLIPQRRGLLAGVAVGLSWSVGKMAVPQLTRYAIDRGISKSGSLLFWTSTILAAAIIAGVFAGWRRFIAFRESRLTETVLRERLFAQIQGLHVGFHDRTQTGQLMSRASSDLLQVQGFVVNIPIFASQVTMVFGVVAVLFLTDPLLAAVALAPLPFINISARSFSHKIHPTVLAVQQEQAQLASVVEESVSGIRVIKGFGAEAVQQAKLEIEADDIRRESMKAARIRSRFLPAIDLLPGLGLVAVLGLGGHRVISGDMSLGGLVAFNAYLTMLIWPMRNIGMTVAMGQRAASALVRIHEILAVVPAIADPPHPLRLPQAAVAQPVGAVKFENVRFGYEIGHTDIRVLEGFNFSVAPGESVAIVGATGSGKSTIAGLAATFLNPKGGKVTIDGIDISTVNLSSYRSNLGVVLQDDFLYEGTIRENILFPRPYATEDQLLAAVQGAYVNEFTDRFDLGLDTVIGERGVKLSGGQRQRISIARALLADPKIIILDEATSNLDTESEAFIQKSLHELMKDRTTFVIAHRLSTIQKADQILVIEDGNIVEKGKHDALIASKGRYWELFTYQSRI